MFLLNNNITSNIDRQRHHWSGAMPEILKIILMILLVIGAIFISVYITGLRMRKAAEFIMQDLREKKAFDPASAVELSYAKGSLLNFGLRDYRPQALQELLKQGVVQIQEEGRYFLSRGDKDHADWSSR
jgi:hypothetical protein